MNQLVTTPAAIIKADNPIHHGLPAAARQMISYIYGAYRENGGHTAPSNKAFDQDLRGRNPEWGVRDLKEVAESAKAHGLKLAERIPMPANNLSLVFRR